MQEEIIMRIVLGVSSPENHVHAMQLLAALRFPKSEIHAVHAVDRLAGPEYFGLPPGSGDVAARIEAMQQEGAEAELRDAAARLENLGLRAIRREVLGGFPGSAVCTYSDSVKADLIALGWEKHGPVEGLLAGSVARSVVVHAKQSILLAKHPHEDKPVSCVLATDHSPYMNECIQRFISWHPAGIANITILSAFPHRMASTLGQLMPDMAVNIRPWVEQQLIEKNESLMRKITDLGPVVTDSIVTREPVHKAIADTMRERSADLLIIGAHGHGFFGRAMLGSVSYPQAITEPHSVLILRGNEAFQQQTTKR
ncbi:MAG: universal stress protein [Proteobacteria bacterium]|nr:universal stress protein [Pseudomonadota bacterium]